jgi:hypothetical protein
LRRVAMTNPFVTLKRLFEGTQDVQRPSSVSLLRGEKNFMKYDLTADPRF